MVLPKVAALLVQGLMVRTECSPARNAIAKYVFPIFSLWSLQFKPLVIQHLLCS